MGLVSKQFRSLAEPCLYASINLVWTPDHKPPLAPLLRSILSRPELGLYVRHLRLDGTGFTKSSSLTSPEPIPLPVSGLPMSLALQRIRSTGIPCAEDWERSLQDGAADAIVTLLVTMLPDLESLHIGPNFAVENFRLGAMFRCALQIDGQTGTRTLPKFQCLSHISLRRRLRPWRHPEANNTADVLPFFSLPSIQDLSISIDNPKTWPFDLRKSSVVSMQLFTLRETYLGQLLAPLSALQTLHWQCHYQENIDSHASKPFIALDTLVKALHVVKNTLVELSVEASSAPDPLRGEYEAPEFQVDGSLEGLQSLEHLKSLSLPWSFLFGSSPDVAIANASSMTEVLPASLEVLTLTPDLLDDEHHDWQDSVIVEAIKAALGGSQSLKPLPHLKRVVLPIPFDNEIDEELKAELKRLSRETGVSLELEDDQ